MAVSFDPDPTLGALLVGVLASVFLFGIVTVQTYLYFDKFEDDSRGFKVMVLAVWVFDLAHTISVSHSVYNSTITLYAHPEKLIKFLSLSAAVFFGGLITFLTQGFFSVRIHKILGTPLVAYVCYLLSAARLIGSLFISVEGFKAKSIQEYQADWGWLITTLLTVGAALDVIIAISMSWYVGRNRSTSLDRGTKKVLDRLMMWTVQTGLATSVAAVAVVICFQLMPHNFIWLNVYTVLAKLYSNSLLASLNARTKLRKLYPPTSSADGVSTAQSYPDRETGDGHLPIPRQLASPITTTHLYHQNIVEIPMSSYSRSPVTEKKQYHWDGSEGFNSYGVAR